MGKTTLKCDKQSEKLVEGIDRSEINYPPPIFFGSLCGAR
jgi:hypothetical protein